MVRLVVFLAVILASSAAWSHPFPSKVFAECYANGEILKYVAELRNRGISSKTVVEGLKDAGNMDGMEEEFVSRVYYRWRYLNPGEVASLAFGACLMAEIEHRLGN